MSIIDGNQSPPALIRPESCADCSEHGPLADCLIRAVDGPGLCNDVGSTVSGFSFLTNMSPILSRLDLF